MEASADTWCSIGVLYQEQNQPMDALQAYFCAVQLDKCHSTAWANLGTLYESKQQYKEALKCFRNSINGESPPEYKAQIKNRIPLLETVIAKLPDNGNRLPIPDPNKPNQPLIKLPTVDEAWSLPIPSELTQRQLQLMLAEVQGSVNPNHNANLNAKRKFVAGLLVNNDVKNACNAIKLDTKTSSCNDTNITNSSQKPVIKVDEEVGDVLESAERKIKEEEREGVQPNVEEKTPEFLTPSLPLTQHQKERLMNLITRGHTLSSGERQEMTKLQSILIRNHFGISSPSLPGQNNSNEVKNEGNSNNNFVVPNSSGLNNIEPKQKMKKIDDENNIEDQNNEDNLPPVDDLDFITEDLLAQLNTGVGTSNLDLVDMAFFSPDSSTALADTLNVNSKTDVNLPKEVNRPGLVDDLRLYLTNDHLQKEFPSIISSNTLNIKMSSKMVLNTLKGLEVASVGEWWPSLNETWSKVPIAPPDVVVPRELLLETRQSDNDDSTYLHPATPTIYLENRKDTLSNELFQFCITQPAVVIRGLASVLRMDLSLFSTKSLVEANPEHTLEIRTQKMFPPEDNRDPQGKKSWYFNSPRTSTTISKYAAYQASTFVTALKDEKANNGTSLTGGNNAAGTNQGPSNTGKGVATNQNEPSTPLKPKVIRFGTNCDLSDEKKWQAQLHELNKLPAFLRVISGCNMLSHVGYNLLGMNTVQMYMKVPGARTPGHQENNNMCAVNINIGPGDCEWFIVPEQHWGTIYRLCEKNNIDYLSGSWWPLLDELEEASIPVYRFIQRPGDLVWLSPGSVHWVQALGWCNNIAWNVGPLYARQYEMAFERYEFNRLKGFKSIVPMLHLTVQLTKNIKITDPHLYELMKLTLLRCLVQSQISRDFIENILKLPIKYHGKKPDDIAHTCYECECEVFNLLYVCQQEKQFVVRCFDCSRKLDPTLATFTILCEYHQDHLAKIYDSFKLQNKPVTAYAVNKS